MCFTSVALQCYVGHLPKDMFEDTLVPIFEAIGPLYDVRIMMDAITGTTRGYAFVTYIDPEHSRQAAEQVR